MNRGSTNSETNSSEAHTVPVLPLLLSGVGMVTVAISLLVISFFFEKGDATSGRPQILVQILLASAFIWYLGGAIFSGFFRGGFFYRRLNEGRIRNPRYWSRALWLILGVGLTCRILLVFSVPIQELDLYRYIWDGATISEGVSPYSYPPKDIASQRKDERGNKLRWEKGEENLEYFDLEIVEDNIESLEYEVEVLQAELGSTEDLEIKQQLIEELSLKQESIEYLQTKIEAIEDLQAKLKSDEGLAECFSQVHYGQYSSPYPPVSQAIFNMAYRLSRSRSEETGTYYAHLVGMKSVIVLFDFLTAIVIVFLLAHLGLPRVWVVAYWWCPLVIKEFSNSGHLDSFAVFFCILAVFAAMKAIVPRQGADPVPTNEDDDDEVIVARNPLILSSWVGISAVALALGVGAKVFPLFVFPVWFVALFRTSIWRSLIAAVIFFAVTAAVMWPMIRYTELGRTIAQKIDESFLSSLGLQLEAPNITDDSGIEVFSKWWEMNDLPFMLVVENLKVRMPEGFEGVEQIGVIGLPGYETNLRTSLEGTDVKVRVGLLADASEMRELARENGFTEENGTLGDVLEVIGESDIVLISSQQSLANKYKEVVEALQPGSTVVFSNDFFRERFSFAGVDFPPEVNVITTTADYHLKTVQASDQKATKQLIRGWSYAAGYHKLPWFIFTSEESRREIRDRFFANREAQISEEIEAAKEADKLQEVQMLEGKMSNERSRVPFALTRLITLGCFCLLVGFLCVRMFFVKGAQALATLFGDGVFLSLAWFWFLSPTQNPWYWTWAMAALVLVRNRWWFAISGLSLLYYLRFYFDYDWPRKEALGAKWQGADVLGTGTYGVDFFYFYVPWIEFGPWLIVLFCSWIFILIRRRSGAEKLARQAARWR